MRSALFFSLMIGLAYVSNGQDTISNPNSIDKIPYYEQLYRFRVNRVIDLNEKQNAGFNSPKSSITKLIVDLLRGGKLHTFGSNVGDPADFQDKMADTLAFNLNTNFVRSGTQGEFDPNRGYLAGDLVFAPFTNADGSIEEHQYRILVDINAPAKGQKNTLTSANSVDNGPEKETLSAQKVVGLELIEDVIFDKRRSRLYYDILAIGVELQDDNNNAEGKMVSRFYIPYKEFAKEMGLLAHSKDLNERRRVQWQNRYNPSEGKTFLDAFRLRLFHGVIRKVENPDDMTIQRIFENNGRSYSESVFARWEEEMKLMEKEHNLWEY